MQCARNSGFILLETLPALVLLLAVFIVGMSCERIRLRLLDIEATGELRPGAYENVYAAWVDNPDNLAALSTMTENGTWEILDLPDESWLPLDQNGTTHTTMWRRSPNSLYNHCLVWRIEVYQPRTGKWEWWLNVDLQSDSYPE